MRCVFDERCFCWWRAVPCPDSVILHQLGDLVVFLLVPLFYRNEAGDWYLERWWEMIARLVFNAGTAACDGEHEAHVNDSAHGFCQCVEVV